MPVYKRLSKPVPPITDSAYESSDIGLLPTPMYALPEPIAPPTLSPEPIAEPTEGTPPDTAVEDVGTEPIVIGEDGEEVVEEPSPKSSPEQAVIGEEPEPEPGPEPSREDTELVETDKVGVPLPSKRESAGEDLSDLFEVPQPDDNDMSTDDLFALDNNEDVLGNAPGESMDDLFDVSDEDIMGPTPKKRYFKRVRRGSSRPPTPGGGVQSIGV